MKKLHKIIAASLLASATAAGSGVVLAESSLTANVGVASNYIWRGTTQTNDASAVSGGIDYSNASGFYAGTWVSNVTWTNTNGYEQDIYAGYAFDAGPVGLDVGYITYLYPVNGDADPTQDEDDFSEVYVNASYKMFSAGLALTTSTEAGGEDSHQYIYVGAEFEVKKDLTLAVTIGDYDFDGGSDSDYTHTQISLSKGDFTFALDDNNAKSDGVAWDRGTDDMRFTVSWSHSIDL